VRASPREGFAIALGLCFLGHKVGDVLASLGQGGLHLAGFEDLKPEGENR
jgi:hypothetical protein